jgi:hypothetical protein
MAELIASGCDGVFSLEFCQAMATALQLNNCLKTLELWGWEWRTRQVSIINDEGAAIIADGLRQNTTLTTLNLRNNKIGNEGLAAIASAMRVNKRLLKSLFWHAIHSTIFSHCVKSLSSQRYIERVGFAWRSLFSRKH